MSYDTISNESVGQAMMYKDQIQDSKVRYYDNLDTQTKNDFIEIADMVIVNKY
jgi:hypothetical protein